MMLRCVKHPERNAWEAVDGVPLCRACCEARTPATDFPRVSLSAPDVVNRGGVGIMLPPALTPASDICVMTLGELLKAIGDNAEGMPTGATLLISIEKLPGNVYRVKSAANVP